MEVERYETCLCKNEKKTNDLWRVLYLQNLLQRFIFLLQTVCIIYIGITGHLTNFLSPDEFVFFISLTGTVAGSLTNVGYLYTRYTQVMARISSIHDILLRSVDKTEYKKKLTKFEKISIQNLTVFLDEKLIFSNLNVKFFNGDKIALVGENGSGKSTFLKVLLGFYTYEGKILIDEEYLKNLFFGNIVSYIPQNTILFNESIKYNITYGCKDIKKFPNTRCL